MRARPDRPVRPLGAIALLVGALALAGCATTDASGAGAESSAPETEAMTAEPMDDATESPEASDAETEPMDDAAAPAEGAYLDYEDGVIEATAGPKALFFHATWCPKCRALDEDLKAQGAPDGLTVFKVDYDSRTDLRQQYGVTLQTTIVFVDDSGEKISSVVLYDDPSVESLVAAMP